MRTALALLSVLVVGLYSAVSGQDVDDCGSYSYGAYVSNMCYYVGHKSVKLGSWEKSTFMEQGAEACNEVFGGAGEPAVIKSLADYETLAKLWRNANAPTFGLNMRFRPNVTHWTWESDQSLIGGQGCYQDDPNAHDLPVSVPVANMTPLTCIAACKKEGFEYAGVQNGNLCYCGNKFGSYGHSSGCTAPCDATKSNENSPKCGGFFANYVYAVGGSMPNLWNDGEPNTEDNGRLCGALDEQSKYSILNVDCSKAREYLCEILGEKRYTDCRTSGYHQYGTTCLYLSFLPLSWHEAREACELREGKLAEIRTQDMHDYAVESITTFGYWQRTWIGVSMQKDPGWKWLQGPAVNFGENTPAWHTEALKGATKGHCAIVSKDKDYKLMDVECGSDIYPILCMRRTKGGTTASPTPSPVFTPVPGPLPVTQVPPPITETPYVEGIDPTANGGCIGVVINRICYFLSENKATGMHGYTQCPFQAVIMNPGTQRKVETMLVRFGSPDVYLDLHEEASTHDWRWVADDTNPAAQGCYLDKADDRDLSAQIILKFITPEICISACTQEGFRYAGLQGANCYPEHAIVIQNGKRCFCGNTFGRHGTGEMCTIPCDSGTQTSALSNLCGGYLETFIYDVRGIMYGQWGVSEPSNSNDYENCAVLDYWMNYNFAAEPCGLQYQFICTLVDSQCAGPYHIKQGSVCMYLGTTPSDWFKAGEFCRVLGGSLVKIGDRIMNQYVLRLIQLIGTTKKYWIGLTKMRGTGFNWRNEYPLTYTNWALIAPSHKAHTCVIISSNLNFAWDDVDCEEEHRFLCANQSISIEDIPPEGVNNAGGSGNSGGDLPDDDQDTNVHGDNNGNGDVAESNGDFKTVAMGGSVSVIVMAIGGTVLYYWKTKQMPCQQGQASTSSTMISQANLKPRSHRNILSSRHLNLRF